MTIPLCKSVWLRQTKSDRTFPRVSPVGLARFKNALNAYCAGKLAALKT